MGSLENSSYPVIVPEENFGKYGEIDLLGTMGMILLKNRISRKTISWGLWFQI